MDRKFPWFSLLVVLFGGLTMVFPFLDMVLTSFKTPQEISSLDYKLLPKVFHFDNYRTVYQNLNMIHLFKNSIIVTVSVTILVLITSTLAAYALTKLKFPGRTTIFRFILATMMFPTFLFLIPNFYIVIHFPLVGGNDIFGNGGHGGLSSSLAALIVPFAVSGFGIFLLRQFMIDIPDALIEAARLDGATDLQIFFHIILPMTVPSLATLAIFTFIAQWNEFIWSLLIYTINNDLATLQVGIQLLQRSEVNPALTEALVNSALTMSTIPIFILFFFLQKYYVQGMMTTGLKD